MFTKRLHILLYSVLLHACCVLGRGGGGVRRAIVTQQFQFVHFLIPIAMLDDTAGRPLCSQTPFKENSLILDVGAYLTPLFPYMRKHTKHDLDMIA